MRVYGQKASQRTGSTHTRNHWNRNLQGSKLTEGLGYKHAAPIPTVDLERVDGVVICTRHPLSWWLSWWRWRASGTDALQYAERPSGAVRVAANLWTSHHHHWIEALGAPGEREDVVWVRFHDYQQDPRGEIQRWAKRVGVPLEAGEVRLSTRHASPNHDAGRDSYDRERYVTRAWRDDLTVFDQKLLYDWFTMDECREVVEQLYPAWEAWFSHRAEWDRGEVDARCEPAPLPGRA